MRAKRINKTHPFLNVEDYFDPVFKEHIEKKLNEFDTNYELYEYLYGSERYVYENVSFSTPIEIIEKKFKFYFPKSKHIIKELRPRKDRNTFNLSCEFSLSSEQAIKEINTLLKESNTYAWTCSSILNITNNLEYISWKNDEELILKFQEIIEKGHNKLLLEFQPVFNTEVHEIPDVLYHACPYRSLNKIMKAGLSPKSRSKRSYHPDRVYLAKTKEDAILFAKEVFLDESPDMRDPLNKRLKRDVFAIIEIKINDTLRRYLKIINPFGTKDRVFFEDPDYTDKSLYTLNHINPYNISIDQIIKFNIHGEYEQTK